MTIKRQRSIAAMFGVKDPRNPTVTVKGTPSSGPSTGKAPSSNTTPKAKSKTTSNAQSKTTMERLAQVAYHMLQPVEPEILLSTLSAEFKELLGLELDPEHGLAPSYLRVLHTQLTKQYFLDLKRFLINEGLNQPRHDIYPSPKNIYHWSRATPLEQIRVVIIGQDPYHGPGQAHGLSFSVPKGIPIPGSLRNIYLELKQEYPGFKVPTHGTLRSWARSGVLLLNTSLTVKKGQAGSHSNKGWEHFTDAVVDAIDLYGGLGLLHDKTSGTVKADHTIEPSPKRVRVDGPSELVADSQPIEDSNPSNLISESNATTSLASDPGKNITNEESRNCSLEKENKRPASPVSSDRPLTEPAPQVKPQDDIKRVDHSTTSTRHSPACQNLAGFGQGVVFLCWGKWAADRVARLSESKHLILKSAHPSPLSAHRGFLGNNHFKLANEWLEKKYGKAAQIDWCTLDPS